MISLGSELGPREAANWLAVVIIISSRTSSFLISLPNVTVDLPGAWCVMEP